MRAGARRTRTCCALYLARRPRPMGAARWQSCLIRQGRPTEAVASLPLASARREAAEARSRRTKPETDPFGRWPARNVTTVKAIRS